MINNMKDVAKILSAAPTGVRVSGSDSSYGELFELGGPYLITIEDFHYRENCAICDVLSPGFHFHEELSISALISRKMHRHSYFELMYVMKGKLTHLIEGVPYTYEAGDACLMNHYVRHLETPSEDTELFFLQISDNFFQQLIKSDIRFSQTGSIVKPQHPVYDFVDRTLAKGSYQKQFWDFTPASDREAVIEMIEPLIRKLIIETNEQAPGFLPMTQGLIARLFCRLTDPKDYAYKPKLLPGDQEEFLYLRMRDILEETHGKISREELAARMNYNSDYLNRIFKKHSGISLMQSGRIYTLNEAARLLKETDFSIAKIISVLGFSNRSHFYQIFRDHFGKSPNEYREK